MMSHPVFRNAVAAAVMRQDGLLPLTETVQGLVGVMVDLQVRLRQNTAVIRQRSGAPSNPAFFFLDRGFI